MAELTLQEKREKREDLYAKSMAIIDKVDAEKREPTQAERDELVPMRRELEALGAEIAEADKKAAEDRETMAAIRKMGAGLVKANDREVERAVATVPAKDASIGRQFLASPQYRAFMAQWPNGQIPDLAKGIHMNPVPFATLITGASKTSGGALVVNDRQDTIVPAVRAMPAFIDIVTHGTTESDTVEYVRVTSETNAAAETAEATAAGDSSGTKPESAMALEVVTEAVKTVAHWIPATKRSLSDAGQLRTLIDGFLRYGLRQRVNQQIIKGTGSGANLRGIDNISGTQTQSWDTDQLVTMRRARTKVKVNGGAIPSAYLMHPNDWEDIELLRDGQDRFYFGGPMALGTKTVWGLPVVEDEAVNEGNGYVSDWAMCVLWLREQASVSLSDSHSDYFVRNLVAILAEERVAFGCLRPAAIVEFGLNAAS